MSKKGLQVLVRKSLTPLAKNESLSSCDHCLVRKQHRVSFSSRSKKLEKLELKYFDVCDPIDLEILEETGTLSLSLMMLPRRYGFICLIRSKDQVFLYFLQFHTMVERETGRKLKCLRSDNGGEFTSREFETYCTKNSIRHEKKSLWHSTA